MPKLSEFEQYMTYLCEALGHADPVRLSNWVIPQSISPEKPLRADTAREPDSRSPSGWSSDPRPHAKRVQIVHAAGGCLDCARSAPHCCERLQELGTEPHLIEAIDRDKNGKPDAVVFDVERDGKWDFSFHDTDYDGRWDLVAMGVW
jgi:hypothetical protein